jgi:hypothetical protein
MTKITLRSLVPLLCVAFWLTPLGLKPAFSQNEDAKTPPVELRELKLEFAVKDDAGNLLWKNPDRAKPNVIPATAQKLRLTAKVTNRPAGSKIKMTATLQELCPSADSAKPFLARLRHLTEIDKEVEVVNVDQPISIELTVHCEDCVHAVCGCECPGKDHLGEGPHLATLTVSDSTTPRNTAPAKPASYRLDIRTVCPGKCKSKATTRNR